MVPATLLSVILFAVVFVTVIPVSVVKFIATGHGLEEDKYYRLDGFIRAPMALAARKAGLI